MKLDEMLLTVFSLVISFFLSYIISKNDGDQDRQTRKAGNGMYGGYIYKLDADKFEKRKEEFLSKIAEFGEDEWNFEDEDLEPLDEAYVVAMRTEEDKEQFYLVLVGDYHFDEDALKDLLYGGDEMYQRYCRLDQKPEGEEWSDEERKSLRYGMDHYVILEDLEEDVQAVLYEGNEELGRVVTRIF